MPESYQEKRWLFVLTTEEKPGVAASVTAAFSGRGITIESFLGYGNSMPPENESRSLIMVIFRAFEQRMKTIQRALQRFEVVNSVTVYDCETEINIIEVASVRIESCCDINALLAGQSVEAHIHPVEHRGERCVIMSGNPQQVRSAVAPLQKSGQLISCVYSLLPPRYQI